MSSLGLTTGHVRHGIRRKRTFTFNKGDLVLVKWTDGMVYFAKIKHIYHRREKCVVVFDDKSQDEADFTQIHSVDETTTDIICIKCKRDDSESPNEIVLCDMCGIGFHQKCHNPIIPASALQLDSPWNCSYCHRGAKCPFLTESLDVLQNLLSDDNESINSDDQVVGMESEGEDLLPNKSRVPRKIKKHRTSQLENLANDRRMSLRTATPTSPKPSSLINVEKNASSGSHGDGPETPNSKDGRSLSEDEDSGVLESLPSSRKRKKYSTHYEKRIKRSSVESHTVSVTRLDTPIFVGGTCELSSPHNKEEVGKDSSLIVSQQGFKHENKTLQVSLSLPEEVEVKPSLKSLLSSIGSPPSLSAPSLSSKISSDVESDNIPVSDVAKCESSKQQPAPFVASPLPRLDLPRIVTSSSRLLTLADVGISESPISSYATDNTVMVGVSQISAAQLPEKSEVTDEDACSPCLAGSSSKVSSPVVNDDMTEQPSVKTLFTDPCATVPAANSALLSSVQQTSDADAVNGSGLEEGMDTEMNSAFDGTTTQTSNLDAEDDATTCNSSANCCEPEVSISSGSREACNASCALLPSKTTNMESELEGPDTKTTKTTDAGPVVDEEHGAIQPEETNLSKQNSPVSDVPSVTNSLPVQSSGLGSGEEAVVIKTKPRPSKLFIKSPCPNMAATPVTTSIHTHPKLKLQILSPNKLGREHSDLTPLDSELASLGSSTSSENVGYSRQRDCPDINVRGDLVSDGMDKDVSGCLGSSHHTSVAILVSKAVELAAKKTAHDDMEAEKLSNADPDVIITGVEPSKEALSRRDSAPCRPSPRHLPPPVGLSTGVACAHLTQSKTVTLCAPTLPVANSANHQVHAMAPPALDPRVGLKSPAHAVSAHNRYQRVPLAVHCRSKSSTHPSSSGPPMYYTSVNPDMMTSMASKQAHSTNATAAKPFAVVNALPMSSSEALQKPGEAGGCQLLQVYNDGNGLSHVYPGTTIQQYAYMLSPDASVGSEPVVSLPNNILSEAKKEEYMRRKIRAEDIQSIQKKIGDAFNTFSETMLMSAFNEAWQKFQANAAQYKNNKEAWNKALIGNQFVGGKTQVQAVTTRPIAPKPATTPVVGGTHGMPTAASSPQYIPTSVLHGGSQKQQYILQPLTSNLQYPTLYAISNQQPHASAAETLYPSSSITIPALPLQSDQSVVDKTPITSKTPLGVVAAKTPPGGVVATKTIPGGLVTTNLPPTLGLATSNIAEDQHAVNQNQVALLSCSSLDERHKQWQQNMLASAPTTSNKPTSLSFKYKTKKPIKMCAKCGKTATFLCSGCRHEWYCGRDCQLRNWDQHADHCKA